MCKPMGNFAKKKKLGKYVLPPGQNCTKIAPSLAKMTGLFYCWSNGAKLIVHTLAPVFLLPWKFENPIIMQTFQHRYKNNPHYQHQHHFNPLAMVAMSKVQITKPTNCTVYVVYT